MLYLWRCNLTTLLVKRQHHSDAISQRQVIPRDVKALAALVGPDCADARPDFLPGFVFARGFAMVENIGWSVWHRNAFSTTASSVGDWQRVSTLGGDTTTRHKRAKEKYHALRQGPGGFCVGAWAKSGQ